MASREMLMMAGAIYDCIKASFRREVMEMGEHQDEMAIVSATATEFIMEANLYAEAQQDQFLTEAIEELDSYRRAADDYLTERSAETFLIISMLASTPTPQWRKDIV